MKSYLVPIDHLQPGIAELYDELPLWSAPFGLRLLERVPARPGLTILDVGAGTGFMTMELAQRCGPSSKVIAVDPWSAALARLRRKVAAAGVGNVELIEADAALVDLPSASVDVIVSNLGINNFANALAVLEVVYKAAKPGASLHLTTNLTGHMAEFYDVYRDTLTELGHPDLLPGLEKHIRHRGTVETVSEMLRAAGFRVEKVETDSFTLRYADGTAMLNHYFIRLGFIQSWAALVPENARDEIFTTLEANLNTVAAKRGELALTIPMAYIVALK